MMNKQKVVCIALAFILMGIMIAVFSKMKASDSVETVEITSPFYGRIEEAIFAYGSLKSQNRLEVIPPIGGRIEQILFDEGDKVKRGDILAWMSSTERAALLDAARAKGEKMLKDWEEAYKATPLIAPIDGEVIVRAVEPGQTVSQTTPVLILSDRLIIESFIDETDIGKIKLGQEASIVLDAYPERKISGKVNHISYDAEVKNNVTVYKLDILPGEYLEFFRSGMSAEVKIVQQSKDNVLLAPAEFVQRTEEGDFVLASPKRNLKPTKRRVELGLMDGANIEILSGLTDKDTITIKKIQVTK